MNKPVNFPSQAARSDADLRLRPARPAGAGEAPGAALQAYVPPALERLGTWSARTLQMTIEIPLAPNPSASPTNGRY